MIFWANIRFYARYTLIHTALRSSLSLNWLTTINISNCVYPCVFKVHRVWGVSKYFISTPQLCVRLVSLSLYSLQFAYHVSTGVYDTNIYLQTQITFTAWLRVKMEGAGVDLINRPQYVPIRDCVSEEVVSSMGTSQDTVLLPLFPLHIRPPTQYCELLPEEVLQRFSHCRWCGLNPECWPSWHASVTAPVTPLHESV